MKSIVSLTLALLLTTLSICSGAAEQERKGSLTWIERPWQMRYFLKVEDAESWQGAMKRAAKSNAAPKATYFWFYEFFSPKEIITLTDSSFSSNKLATILIEFDKDGFVTTPNTHPGSLRGRLNQLSNITLSAGDGLSDKRYDLAHWFMGLGDRQRTVCTGSVRRARVPKPIRRRPIRQGL